MIHITRDEKRQRYSRGLLASQLELCGVSIDEAYEIVTVVRDQISSEEIDAISVDDLQERISAELKRRGLITQDKRIRVHQRLRSLEKPLLVLIGGGPGVGKSSVSAELSRMLGIEHTIGTDTVRQIMRSIISSDLIPTLHQSTFNAWKTVSSRLVKDRLIYGFEQQVDLVSQGLKAVIRRGIAEGIHMIIDGVHVVPGFLDDLMGSDTCFVRQYVLGVEDRENHRARFHARFVNNLRNPEPFIENLDRIRTLQSYIESVAEQHGVPVMANQSFAATVRTIFEDVTDYLAERLGEA